MRIITRPDFDGIVCAALLHEAEEITLPVQWMEANEIQQGLADIREGDIIANLPWDPRCSLWFDHHYSNRIDQPFEGVFSITPSAARIIYEHYRSRFVRDYSILVQETDRIDSADLSLDEVLHPENYDHVLLSMTISGRDRSDAFYWNRLVDLLRNDDMEKVMADSEVKRRCRSTIEANQRYQTLLLEHTRVRGHVSITDFRSFDQTPVGNRFLIFSLFPDTLVNLKIHFQDDTRERVVVHVGHSIFNRRCRVNVGLMLAQFEGGGHRGAGGSTFAAGKSDDYIPRIIELLCNNEDNEHAPRVTEEV